MSNEKVIIDFNPISNEWVTELMQFHDEYDRFAEGDVLRKKRLSNNSKIDK